MTGTERLVLVCGDRDWRDAGQIRTVLSALRKEATVIHGAARGADALAGQIALDIGLDVIAVPANWVRYKTAAGPIRNRRMLNMNPDLVIAFHRDLANSKGTADCVREAIRRGIPVDVHGSPLPQEWRGNESFSSVT